MADIKTHLRELSVATTIGLLKNGVRFSVQDLYDSRKFFQYASDVISNNISSARNILLDPVYTGELRSIVDNGYKLGKEIYECSHFKISKTDEILWLGNDTQKGDPIDIYVGHYGFSLKEESFILKNMGLYELLNCMTGSNFRRGLHVFADFALHEYDAWFAYTWEQLVDYLKKHTRWTLRKDRNISECYIQGNFVVLKFNNQTENVPVTIKTNKQFMEYTSSVIREKVFAKWIKEVLSDDNRYTILKKECSEAAGEQICNYITENYSPSSVYRFFQIYDKEYYYAKTTHTETTVLRVPDKASFPSIIRLSGCMFDVPKSQLNICSTFVNIQTGRQIEFRNECRFSHGQFNGTPEAKMYVARDTSLADLYEPIL